jgi:hypothetical protein
MCYIAYYYVIRHNRYSMQVMEEENYLTLRKLTKIAIFILVLEFVTGVISAFTIHSPLSTTDRTRGLFNTFYFIFSGVNIALLLHGVMGLILIIWSIYLSLVSIKYGIIFSILTFMALIAQIGAAAVGLFIVDVYFNNSAFSLIMLAAVLLSIILYFLILFVAKNYKKLNL